MRVILFGILMMIGLPAIAESCQREPIPISAKAAIPNRGFNHKLFDRLVRIETNYHRCRSGRSALKAQSGLLRVAKTHARWMAKNKNMTHTTTVVGQETLRPRLRRAGVRSLAGAENITRQYRYAFPASGRHRVIDRARCSFAYRKGGSIPVHSYESLARATVNSFIASPAHRKNIMIRRLKTIGTAAALDPRSGPCGHYYVSMELAQ